jgi:hypothetical protein
VLGVKRIGCGIAALLGIFCSGCAVIPTNSHSELNAAYNAERESLAAAAQAVEATPWPKPENVSFVARITGGGGDRVTRTEAVETYVASLQPAGARFQKLATDARTNLLAADRLNVMAMNAADAPRLSMNDVVLLEGAIQALRENRQIYAEAAEDLEKAGEPVSDEEAGTIHDAYAIAIKALGETADLLAARIENNRSETFAEPEHKKAEHFTGT